MNCRFCGNKNDNQRLNCYICGKIIERRVIDFFGGSPAVFEPSFAPAAPQYFPDSSAKAMALGAASGGLISDTGGNAAFGPFLPEQPFCNTLKNSRTDTEPVVVSSEPKAENTPKNKKKEKTKAVALTPAQLKQKQYKRTRNVIVIIMLLIVAAMAWYLLMYNGVISCDFIPEKFINGTIMPITHLLFI